MGAEKGGQHTFIRVSFIVRLDPDLSLGILKGPLSGSDSTERLASRNSIGTMEIASNGQQ